MMTKKTKISVALSILAGIGVAATAIIAHKRSYIYEEKLQHKRSERWNEMSDEEFEEVKDDEDYDPLTKKDHVVIFLKAEAPTLVAGALTIGCIAGAQVLDIQEIAMFAGAAGFFANKYKQLDNKFQEMFPEQYKAVRESIKQEDMKKANDIYKIEESYDGRSRYFFPFLDQIIYMKPNDVVNVQAFISARLAVKGICTANEVADYICQDLRYKDVHLTRENLYWELVPYGDREVREDDFPILVPDYDDVMDDDGEEVPCIVMSPTIEPEPIIKLKNKYA